MKHGGWIAAALAAPGFLAAAARGDDTFSVHAPDLSMDRPADAAPAPTFGAEGSQWWTVGVGAADNFESAYDYNLRGAYSYFVVRDVEFTTELNLWYFNQPGDNAWGINPTFGMRWHFYDTDPWSVYVDLGIGVVVSTDVVPDGGTGVNFTPKAGMGFTRRLDDAGTRLQVGARWHHVSNARIYGDSNNPSRDAFMVYAGIQWPY